MVFKSSLPDIAEVTTDVYSAVFHHSRPEADAGTDDPDRVVFIDALTGKTLTLQQLDNLILRFAAALQDKLQFQRGDVLGVYAPNTVDWAVPAYGALAAGGVLSPANPTYTPEELAHQLRETKAKILIAHPTNVDNAIKACGLVGIPLSKLFVFGDTPINGHAPYLSLLGERKAEPVTFNSAEEAKDTVAFICFSSGTTGLSKGVMTTHANIIANVRQYLQLDRRHYHKDARTLAILPFFHMYGLNLSVLAALYMRMPVIVLPRFELTRYCEAVQKYKITFSAIVPPVALLLAKSEEVLKYDFSSVRNLVCGAAPLDADLQQAVRKRFPQVVIRQGYGLTETSPVVCFEDADDVVPGSSGVLMASSEIKVVNDEGKELGPNERGELWVKGPNIMKGYLNRPEETARCIDKDGYFHTGDVVIVDDKGRIYIVDRIKELIKYKGFQVAPAELEGILLKSPLVADAAVIGVYDSAQATEVPRAYIAVAAEVPRNEETANKLKKYVADQVAHFKQLGSVRFVDAIPKSATGKILRNILRQQVQEELKQQSARARL
ncbi:hypothetical protein BCR43DRAFT_465599 [Syncephalastrum racemosum]|uniref:4-coumarate-CoA ligase n=1 Tax=Syncephalastrum racemosum TaxID=13706 RepID=A0A1X2HSN9_SYNRA|nr:hypothetical protein BCR43DRAFT_465599 [Syncephalastrum racemosum]